MIFFIICLFLLQTAHLESLCLGKCKSGYYYSACRDDCIVCPAGYYCEDGSNNTEACPIGTYNNQLGKNDSSSCLTCIDGTYSTTDGSVACIECEKGYECLNGIKSECSEGYYSDREGLSSCYECPDGHECLTKTDVPEPCLSGEFENSGTCQTCGTGTYSDSKGMSECKTCEAGYKCINGVKTICNEGYISSVGENHCTECGSGTFTIIKGSSVCLEVEEGRYSDSITSSTPCDKGKYSIGGIVDSCSSCSSGQFTANIGSSGCLECYKGMECDGTDMTKCPDGQYSEESQSTCLNCPEGYYCPPSLSPQKCPLGTYGQGEAARTICTECEDGKYANELGMGECLSCPDGYMCNDKTIDPIPCEYGFISSNDYKECVHCEKGKYYSGGACIDCQAGKFCPYKTFEEYSCPTGYISTSKSDICTQCEEGTYSDATNENCVDCEVGYSCANPLIGRLQCNDGYYSSNIKSIKCEICPQGFYCDDGITPKECTEGYSLPGSSKCETCPSSFDCTNHSKIEFCEKGYYSEEGVDECSICPAGSFCSQGAVYECPDGYYSLEGSSQCDICPPGYYCDVKNENPKSCNNNAGSAEYSKPGSLSCTPCPAGFSCADPSFEPIICPSGKYSEEGAIECTSCSAGYKCPEIDNPSSTECLDGEFSFENMDRCMTCQAGFYCSKSFSSNPSICSLGKWSTQAHIDPTNICNDCPIGFYCPNPTELPIACPFGTYTAVIDSIECVLCPAGSYCTSTTTTLCDPGYWSPPGSIDCQPCTMGFTCGSGEISPNPALSECQLNYYCPSGSDTQTPCPAGSFGVVGGRGDEDQSCGTCTPGYYCEEASSPVICPSGRYCPSGTASSDQYPCRAGTYNPNQGAKSESDCISCPEGYYCTSSSSTYVDCQVGFYCPQGTTNYDQHPCPEGTYSSSLNLKDASECITCSPGHYCPEGSSSEENCPEGTYNELYGAGSIHQCLLCKPGWACGEGQNNSEIISCEAGYYCPLGSTNNSTYPCPAGTYSSSEHLHRKDDCEICPEGYYCLEGSSDSDVKQCTPGYFCPGAKTGEVVYYGDFTERFTEYETQYPCPSGTFSNEAGIWDEDNCTICTMGSYCDGTGDTTVTGPCKAGYYCPAGTKTEDEFPCPVGTFSNLTDLTDSSECWDCGKGNYCPEGSDSEIPCPGGSYSPSGNYESVGPVLLGSLYDNVSCLVCPAGKYCVEGESTPKDCDIGKFSEDGKSYCDPCERGYYCDGGTSLDQMRLNKCPEGFYCDEGTNEVPDDNYNCSSGYYCPEATQFPIPCPKGTYNPAKGVGSIDGCIICPEGSYCLTGSSSISGECEEGYYCEEGSHGPYTDVCPGGTFRNITGAGNVGDCFTCEGGYYCPFNSNNMTDCPAGYYCPVGVSSPVPCPIGTYHNSSNFVYESDCWDCPAGYFCDGVGITVPTGLCEAGYYCEKGATTSKPNDDETGGLCPKGGYCDKGSSSPLECPEGTYNNFTGGTGIDSCFTCPSGFYCEGTNNYEPTGMCEGGYYCTKGSNNSTMFITPKGFFTTEGSSSPIPCPIGTFSNETKMSLCHSCIKGYYCPELNSTEGIICEVGYYCPEGSSYQIECPPGTFSNQNGRYNATGKGGCIECTPGYYCERKEGGTNTAVTGACARGYYCTGGSLERTPIGKSYGDVCPLGNYCPQGSDEPTQCPVGTYNPTFGRWSLSHCLNCEPGYYCPEMEMNNSTNEEYICNAGYYCVSGAKVGNPTDGTTGNICPKGYYCPIGSVTPIPCENSTFANETGQEECYPCPSGYYCSVGTIFPSDCPEGSYCPENSQVPTLCPAGTFRNITNGKDLDDCFDCVGGMYCELDGTVNPQGLCFPGYFCKSGAKNEYGDCEVTENGGICPTGHYCPEGTDIPNPCPLGYYLNSEEGQSIENCIECTPHYYCNETGLSKPVDYCDPGFYCPSGSSSQTEVSCYVGHYCINGEMIPCEEGYYQDEEEKSSCKICSVGNYCPFNTSSPIECSEGYYCEEGIKSLTFEIGCPKGTYGDAPGLVDSSECKPCEAGMYCGTVGLTWPDGNCSEGYYCEEYAIDNMGRKFNGDTEKICERGKYCPLATTTQLDCPEGTFSSKYGNVEIGDCVPCTPGKYCAGEGNYEITGDCSQGYYCLSEAKTSQPIDGTTGDICPQGHCCPTSSVMPIPCEVGTYIDVVGQSSCLPCPAGFYCETRTITPLDCKVGEYCTIGMNGRKCPPGTFNNKTGLESVGDCALCPGGKVCSTEGLSDFEELEDCEKGYYCPEGAKNNHGELGAQGGSVGGICPIGFYCPEGTAEPIACPDGFYNPKIGQDSVDGCILCPAGSYCQNHVVSGLCLNEYYCPPGQEVSNPPLYPCPVGNYCPEGSEHPVGCEEGTYQNEVGKDTCKVCPEGYYCREICSTPLDCPEGHYCPEGTGFPIFCPDGSYSESTGLSDPLQCDSCPAGKYCKLGEIIGDCYSGHICYYNNTNPTPDDELPYGDLCPVGYYCLEGSKTPTPCDAGTVSTVEGAKDRNTCGPCPMTFHCIEDPLTNTTVATPCPRGYYCPSDSSPIACKIGTYNPNYYGGNESSCWACEEGYFCNETAIWNLTVEMECPEGYFCPDGSIEPTACPIGTYNPSRKGTSISESCLSCKGGFYCPESKMSTPVQCPKGYYCQEGSSEPKECPPGRLCTEQTSQPLDCWEGYYCTGMTSIPELCDEGPYYCPLNSKRSIPCELGWEISSYSQNVARATQEDACTICPAGYYGNEDRSECKVCAAGYVCLEGATSKTPLDIETQNGYICPAGYMCPNGTTSPIPCEKGYYQRSTGQSECLICPSDHYQDEEGQSFCKVCGANSKNSDDHITCNCIGYGRSYQKSDGHCLCYPGYVHIEENIQQENKDSNRDCQEIVYDLCEEGTIRNILTGNCESSEDCTSFCSYNNNTIYGVMRDSGICECQQLVDVNEICDSECRYYQLKLRMDSSGKIRIYDPESKSYLSGEYDLPKFSNENLECSEEYCEIEITQMSSNGIKGLYDLSENSLDQIMSEETGRRALGDEEKGIYQPLTCLERGKAMLWEVDCVGDADGVRHYPYYEKDSIINTNEYFDYGAFRELENYCKSSLDITTFIYVFTEDDAPGVYVFRDAGDESKKMIIRVMEEDTKCPNNAAFVAIESEKLVSLGIGKSEVIRLSPDWWLIAGLVLSALMFVVVFLGGVKFFVSGRWTKRKIEKATYRKELNPKLIQKAGLHSKEMKQLLEEKSNIKDEEDSKYLINLEDFDVEEFRKMIVLHLKKMYVEIDKYKVNFIQVFNEVMEESGLIKNSIRDKFGLQLDYLDIDTHLKKISRIKEEIESEKMENNSSLYRKLITVYEERRFSTEELNATINVSVKTEKHVDLEEKFKYNKLMAVSECKSIAEKIENERLKCEAADSKDDLQTIEEVNLNVLKMIPNKRLIKYWNELNKIKGNLEKTMEWNITKISRRVKELLNEGIGELEKKYKIKKM